MFDVVRRHSWITVTVAAMVPSIIAGVIEYALTRGVSGWIPLVSGLGGALGTIVLLWALSLKKPIGKVSGEMSPEGVSAATTNRPDITPYEKRELPKALDTGRVFSRRTPAELIALVKGHTEIMAKHVGKPHIGHWMKVEGAIINVQDSGLDKVITVHMNESRNQVTVFLDFDKKRWESHVSALAIGDRIAAIGRIDIIAQGEWISLNECEMLTLGSYT